MTAIRTTAVHNYLAYKAANYLSEELKTEVKIEGFYFNFLLHPVFNNILILDQNGNILLSADKLEANLKKVEIAKQRIVLRNVEIVNGDINLCKYKNDSTLNLKFIIDYFSSPKEKATEKAPWIIALQGVSIKNTHFSFNNYNTEYVNDGTVDYAHLDLSNLNIDINNVSIIEDKIKANIKNLSFAEQSGFTLNKFKADAFVSSKTIDLKNLIIETNGSSLDMNLVFQYDSWKSYNNFLEDVYINSNIKKSKLDVNDITYFAGSLKGMREVINISGKVSGPVAMLSLKDFNLSYNENTKFLGDIRITGLPDINETFIRLKINKLTSSASDLASISLPSRGEPKYLELPQQIMSVGDISIEGKFAGFINDFVAEAEINTDIGAIKTNLLLTNNSNPDLIAYNGSISSYNVDIGKLINNNILGEISFNGDVSGKGLNINNADIKFDGKVDKLNFKDNDFNDIQINAKLKNKIFEGKVFLDDELAGIDFDGRLNLNGSSPDFNFIADLKNINLSAINLMPREDNCVFSTTISTQIVGNDLDSLNGSITFKNTDFNYKNKNVKFDNIVVAVDDTKPFQKKLSLKSDYFSANISGNYNYNNFKEYYNIIVDNYIPSVSKSDTIVEQYLQDYFNFNVNLDNVKPLTDMFVPKLYISPQTYISGYLNCNQNAIDIKTKTDLIQYANISFFDADIDINNNNYTDIIDANITAKAIVPSKTNRIDTTFYIFENFNTKVYIVDNRITYNILWDNRDYSADNGNIVGHIDLKHYPKMEIINSNSYITYHDSTWNLFPNSKITIDSNAILVDNFGMLHNKQKLALNGVISPDINDEILVNISNFDVSIIDFLTVEKNMDFDGIITGSAKVASVLGSPRLDADFYLDKFGFNGERLGSAKILSIWDNIHSELNLDVQVVYKGNFSTYYPIKVLGKVMPYNKADNFALDIEMDNFNISTLEPFTEGTFSRIRGLALGKLNLSGTFSEPVLLGNLSLMRSEFLIDYLKTSYSFTGNINLAEDKIWFKDITLTDSIGKTGIASGAIYHKNFSDLTTDINIVAKNLSALNTEYSPDQFFYGKAIVSGLVDITGPFDNLNMDIKIRTEQGTDVVIPLNSSTSINDNDFIIFRNSEESDSITFDHFVNEKGGLNVSLGIEANPNAKLGIVLPNQLGDIEVTGEGNIAIDVNTKGGYAMHGEYVMEKGAFNFNFENILKRTFSISSGSSITFNGSPLDANVDISAVYKLRTSVNTLPGMSEYGDVRVPVNCVLKMKNNLFNPDLSFTIDLPDVDNEIRQKIFSVIDTSSVTAMNQQMISLLVLNSFSSNSGVMLAETGILSSTELFTNQINNWLSQISKDFDIGVKYRPGSDISTQDLELVLSTQLFDNRVTINGSFGSSYSASTQSNRWIGDMEVEVKITPDGRLRTKVFNRTNTALSYITEQSPYTQGVGIYYRREFDIIKEFFKNKSQNARNK